MSEIDMVGQKDGGFSQDDAEGRSHLAESDGAPFESDRFNQVINPATGLLMVSGDLLGVDVGGNTFGSDSEDHFAMDDHFAFMDHGSNII